MQKPNWHWLVDRLLAWGVVALVLFICLVSTCALAKPRAVHDAPIEAPSPGSAGIQLAPPQADAIQAAPTDLPALRVAPEAPAQPQVQQPTTEEVEQSLARLTRQANAAKPSRETSLAAWQLGLIHLHGAGVPADAGQAQSWFELAARGPNGVPQAWAGVAWCHIQGCGGPPNPDRARAAIQALRATMGGRAEYLQWLLNEQQAPVAVARPGAAPSHAPAPVNGRLLQAARQGDAQARVELGIQAATRREYTEAQRWFRSATGSRAAAINLQRVDEMARVSQRTAAPNTSRAEALFDQAQKLHRGQGAPANYAEAIRLYRQAAQMGHGPARAMLELIFSRPGLNGQVNLIWMQQLAYVDTRQSLPRIAPSTVQPQLVRDPTPLFDLMPAFWQRQVPAAGI